MIRAPIYQVDAFTTTVFRGNPAAVCLLPHWLPDALLQAVAAENNLSETAFVVTNREPAPLRWFTPTEEVPLCGHATLAAGFVVLTFLAPDRHEVMFTSKSGTLRVGRSDDAFSVDLPKLQVHPVSSIPKGLLSGLGVEAREVWQTKEDPNYLVILDDAAAVANVDPDFDQLARLHPHGVAVSAPGASVDFVSRYFAPGYGILEDPVTGSIHCSLGPYWSGRLGLSSLRAEQLSARGGRLEVVVGSGRVRLRGGAVCYMLGEVLLPVSVS